MNTTKDVTHRELVIDEYMPLQLRALDACQDAKYYTIREDDHSLLELTFDQNDSKVKRITLLLCRHCKRMASRFSLPDNYDEGDVVIDKENDENATLFECVVYDDAVSIIVSDEPVTKSVLSDNVLWRLSAKGNLVAICIIQLTNDAVEHCYSELQQSAQEQ